MKEYLTTLNAVAAALMLSAACAAFGQDATTPSVSQTIMTTVAAAASVKAETTAPGDRMNACAKTSTSDSDK